MATSCGIYRATEVSNDKAELFYDRDPHTMSFKVQWFIFILHCEPVVLFLSVVLIEGYPLWIIRNSIGITI